MATQDEARIGRSALSKVSWRLLPLLGIGYGISYMDRVNISFAALRMNADLHFSASVYGLGGGLFFLAYALMELPSNLILAKVGARRWIARIMLTWGVLAAGMMFVRTPMQFYVMRFLLGAAEAGFFPGAVYYLMHWFPAAWRGRAISRFYVAFPLSNVVMGAVAGALMSLHGRLGLAGWQWLFLVEGLPAVLLSGVFLRFLPDAPATAAWLTAPERAWIADRLAGDRAAQAREPDPGLLPTLTSPLVIGLGLVNLLYLGSGYAFSLSAPTLLAQATHLNIANVGYLVAAGGLLGGCAMLANSWSSDTRRERHLHVAVPLVLLAMAYGAMSAFPAPATFALAYLTAQMAAAGLAAVYWLIASDRLAGRSAAGGVAAINAIGMIGSFVMPWAWGLLHDATGSYAAGLRLLPIPFLIAAGIILWLRAAARRDLARLAGARGRGPAPASA
jgi:ACS family tartrate transporter-like MFS transporter